jgi:hypothetical protein
MVRRVIALALMGTAVMVISACTADPTDLTRTIHVNNQLGASIFLQVCASLDCLSHTGGHLIAPGNTSDEIVEDTSLNPFRVVAAAKPHRTLGCFKVGPHIRDGTNLKLSPPLLAPCP